MNVREQNVNILVIHWPSNTIMNGWAGVNATERLIIDHRYKGNQWYVMSVCSKVFEKYEHLTTVHNTVSVNHLVRVSKAFLAAIKHLSPRWRYNRICSQAHRMGLT